MTNDSNLQTFGKMAIGMSETGQRDNYTGYDIAVSVWFVPTLSAAIFCNEIAARLGMSKKYSRLFALLQLLAVAFALIDFLILRKRKAKEREIQVFPDAGCNRQIGPFASVY